MRLFRRDYYRYRSGLSRTMSCVMPLNRTKSPSLREAGKGENVSAGLFHVFSKCQDRILTFLFFNFDSAVLFARFMVFWIRIGIRIPAAVYRISVCSSPFGA